MSRLWTALLLLATHKERGTYLAGHAVKLRPGQFVTGRDKLAEHTGYHRSTIDRLLKKLEIEQQIEQQKTTKGRIITIVNWDIYQGDEQQSEQQVSNKRATSEHYTRKKECKNGRKRSPAEIVTELEIDTAWKPPLEEWLAYKQERGESYKPRGLKGLITKITRDMSPASFSIAVSNSIASNYSGLFQPKMNGRSEPARPKPTTKLPPHIPVEKRAPIDAETRNKLDALTRKVVSASAMPSK